MKDPAAPRVLTVLRGAQRADAPAAAPPPAPAPAPSAGDATQSIYGVPASAVQHCCGRGCRHCRIYWHRSLK
jgi:hypothetical protein